MTEKTYAITHLVGTSPDSIDDAIRNGLRRAGETLRNLDWFEVTEIRGHLAHTAEVQQFQVTMKVGFRYDD
jgi:flavin-binding protein dodecin